MGPNDMHQTVRRAEQVVRDVQHMAEELRRLQFERDAVIEMCIRPNSVGFEVAAGWALDDTVNLATKEEAIACVKRAALIEHSAT
jgi:hypothetical protein